MKKLIALLIALLTISFILSQFHINKENISENHETQVKNIMEKYSDDTLDKENPSIDEKTWCEYRDICLNKAVEYDYENIKDLDNIDSTYKFKDHNNGLKVFYIYRDGNFEKCECIKYKFKNSEWGYDISTDEVYRLGESKDMFNNKLLVLLKELKISSANALVYNSENIDFLVSSVNELEGFDFEDYLNVCNRYLAELKGVSMNTISIDMLNYSMNDKEVELLKEKLQSYFRFVDISVVVFNGE